jgi:hypothetical protein
MVVSRVACRSYATPPPLFLTFAHTPLQTLTGINPDVALESYTMNITSLQGFDAFKASLTTAPSSAGGGGAGAGGSGGGGAGAGGGEAGPAEESRVDLVLSCVDNYEARMTINQARLAGTHMAVLLADVSSCCALRLCWHTLLFIVARARLPWLQSPLQGCCAHTTTHLPKTCPAPPVLSSPAAPRCAWSWARRGWSLA